MTDKKKKVKKGASIKGTKASEAMFDQNKENEKPQAGGTIGIGMPVPDKKMKELKEKARKLDK